jgi:glycosyltransferase involved in cell wall biosynthesis
MHPVPILFTIPNFITAGSGRAMLNIISRLDRARFAPAVCVLKKGGRLDDVVVEMGLPFLEAPFTLPPKPYPSLLWRSWQAAQVFRPYRFALWHSFHYSNDYTEALIARFAGAKAWVYTKKNMGWGSRAWYLRSWLASSIACQNSDMLRRFFSSAVYARKAHLLPPGVDTTLFYPDVPPILEIRSRLGILPGEVVIACVAELVPIKGHVTLLNALTSLPGVHLLLAGRPSDEPYSQQLHHQAETLGITQRTHFLGRVENIPALLAESDIFVLPSQSRGEGCAIALLEAMACAKACVATDVPGSRDVIQHHKNGLLTVPEDHQSLAQALHLLITDPALRERLGQAAAQHIQLHYTIEREAADYEALYGAVLAR